VYVVVRVGRYARELRLDSVYVYVGVLMVGRFMQELGLFEYVREVRVD
jgi:hypothetical protein